MNTTVHLIAPDFLGSAKAACYGKGDRMYPYRTKTNEEPVRRAKAICAVCPYQVSCLLWALKTGEQDGIWGGTTPEERATLNHARTIIELSRR